MINPLTVGRAFGTGVIIFMSAMILISAPVSRAALCKRWSDGEKAGALDHLQIDEASGIAVSSKFPGRLYHVNDSGSGPYFYLSDLSGGKTRAVRIEGFDAVI
ncbi:MAG: hypothetical protein L0213_11360, partial [Candidatus Dadabacteria bacterium]|nr:hypothetical protein [Candidatus Dadabacteria bacterium]